MPVKVEFMLSVAKNVPAVRIHEPNRMKEWAEALMSAARMNQRQGEKPIDVAKRAVRFATHLCLTSHYRHLAARRRTRAARRARRHQRMRLQ